MFARPVIADGLDFPGIRLVERGIVDDQHATPFVDERFDFLEEGFRIGFEAMNQAVVRIVGGGPMTSRIAEGGFETADRIRDCDQKLDVLAFMAFGLTHARIIWGKEPGRNACMCSQIA